MASLLVPLTFFVVHSYRKGVLRELRAKWLRRKIVNAMQALLPQIRLLLDEESGNRFPLFRLRAELEQLHSHNNALLDEEKARLSLFLASVSALVSSSEAGSASSVGMNDVIMLGQRIIHESTELGF